MAANIGDQHSSEWSQSASYSGSPQFESIRLIDCHSPPPSIYKPTAETVEAKEAESNWTAFSLPLLTRSHGGKYSCRSCLDGIECSTFSDEISLNLTDPEMMNPTMETIPGGSNASDILSPYLWAGIGVSVFLVVLLLAVVLYRKRRKTT